ncbi:MAG: hypothetical protein ACRELX_04040 [Longimicrobiales bacterium]
MRRARTRPWCTLGAAALLAALAAACETPLEERILDTSGEGQALMLLFLDNDLNGRFDPQVDEGIPDAILVVRRTAAPEDSNVIRTDTSGLAFTPFIGVGQYQAEVRPTLLGDSLLASAGTAPFTILPNDTVAVALGVSFLSISITEARQSPVGRKAWVRGTMLNDAGAFGDSTLHIADTLAAIRAVNLRASPGSPGDSVQLLGLRRDRDGQPVIEFQSVLIYPAGGPLPRDTVTSAEAAAATGEAGDAELVFVQNAAITDTLIATPEGRELTVDDGSGPLTVLLDDALNFSPLNVFLPGVRIDLTGLLVPRADGTGWLLKPRGRADITFLLPTP